MERDYTKASDFSPELKKGEIKDILIRTAKEMLPDFDFLTYKNHCYTFQKLRIINGLTVYETLHIAFSLKNRNFACSIASRLNPIHIHLNSYNIGLINPHIDLKFARYKKGTLYVQDAYYFHNGQVETTTNRVKEIFSDYKKFGLSFLDEQIVRLQTNEIISAGLEYIDNLKIDKQKLKLEVETELIKEFHLISRLKQPTYLSLKETLQKVHGQCREHRQLIPKTAYEFLELYWTK